MNQNIISMLDLIKSANEARGISLNTKVDALTRDRYTQYAKDDLMFAQVYALASIAESLATIAESVVHSDTVSAMMENVAIYNNG